MSDIRRIGIIGVGRMGAGIAINLNRHGFTLGVVANVNRSTVEDLVQNHGATEFATPSKLAGWADAILLCLPSSDQVDDVCCGENGVLDTKEASVRVIVDCSTSLPTSTLALLETFKDRGIQFFDAPLTRTPKEAIEGRLNAVLGGGDVAMDAVGKVLEAFCENVVSVQEIGDGHRLKLVNNALSMGMAALAAETLAASRRAGLDLGDVHTLVSLGGANSAQFQGMIAAHVRGEAALEFSLENAAKDLKYFQNGVASDGGTPISQEVSRAFLAAVDVCGGRSTLPALFDYYVDQVRGKEG